MKKLNSSIIYAFFLSITILFQSTNSFAFADYTPVPDESVLKMFSQITEDVALPSVFDMVVWNVHKGTAGSEFEMDVKFLARNKHLILLQEAMNDTKMPELMTNINYGDIWMAQSFRDNEINATTGVATLSKAKAHHVFFRRSSGTEPIINTPKMVLGTVYKLESGSLVLILNIHAINFVSNIDFENQIKDLVPIIGGFPGKVIFGGDFNTWNVDRLIFLYATMKKLGMTKVEFKNGTPENDLGFLLDHIFVRGCTIEDAKVARFIYSSDHYPMMARFNCN